MKKFAFRLQPVLKLRRQQEDQKKRVVGAILAEMNEYQRQAVEMARAVEDQRGSLKQNIQGRVNVRWIAHYQGYVTSMQQAINTRVNSVAQLQQKLAVAREELAEAAKRTKIVEKLRERRKARYDTRLKRLEVREMDEAGANTFLRSREM